MLFAGDVMAHANNYRTGNFDKIWEGIGTLAKDADFAFANIEAPVSDSIGWSTYPQFNMKSEYPEAAINAGFNVFSLINNHTNDKGSEGIEDTLAWSQNIATTGGYTSTTTDDVAATLTTENNAITPSTTSERRRIYFSGIHNKRDTKNDTKKNDIANAKNFDYTIIEKDGWKILFVAITELLNQNIALEYMNFNTPTKESRSSFCKKITEWRKESGCNFCVVSIHSNEAEYIRDVTAVRRQFYYDLLDAGADVVWSNHPHVIKERELVGKENERNENILRKLIMYANGNTISGQRRSPNFDDAADYWEWTGDGVLVSATFEIENKDAEPKIVSVKSHYITTYITTSNQHIIKLLDDDFINYLGEAKRPSWKNYMTERKILVEKTKEITTWR